jgi:hypothetical protein
MLLPLLISSGVIAPIGIVVVVELRWRTKRYWQEDQVGRGGLVDSIGCMGSRSLSPGH